MSNLDKIVAQLMVLHPTFTGLEFDGEAWIKFSDGPSMEADEFMWGSETRNLLHAYAELKRRQ